MAKPKPQPKPCTHSPESMKPLGLNGTLRRCEICGVFYDTRTGKKPANNEKEK